MSDDELGKLGRLKAMALQLSDKAVIPEEQRKQCVTEILNDSLPKMLRRGELINAQFNGEPGTGKSLGMIAFVLRINKLLNKVTTIHHIFANQITYGQSIKQLEEKEYHMMVGIDEYDTMGETGYNATTDQAWLESFSDLQRARYIHKAACAPKDTIDKNVNLVFDMPVPDKERKITRFLLYYRLFREGRDLDVLLGYVDIDVSEALKSKLYQDYHKRKMERLTLFSKHGIQHERHIYFAKVILDAYEELRTVARMGKVERDLCELQIDISSRKFKQINSIIGANKHGNDLSALLKIVSYQEKEKEAIKKLKSIKMKLSEKEIKELVEAHANILKKLVKEEENIVEYWKAAAALEPMFTSKLHEIAGKEEEHGRKRQHTKQD